jgi:hypothetical protein
MAANADGRYRNQQTGRVLRQPSESDASAPDPNWDEEAFWWENRTHHRKLLLADVVVSAMRSRPHATEVKAHGNNSRAMPGSI